MTPDQAAYWREQGMAAARAGDRAAANAALQHALRLNPRDADAWFWLAVVQTNPQHALMALDRALTLNPQHAQALAGRAAVRASLGLDTPPAPPAPATAPASALAPAPPETPARSPAASMANGPAPSPFATTAPPTGPSTVPAPVPPGAAPSPFSPVVAPPIPPPAPPSIPPPPPTPVEDPLSTLGALYSPPPANGAAVPETGVSLAELADRGIVAAKAGRIAEARTALLAYVERDERNEDVWYWLSRIVDDPADIRVALENTLELNPHNLDAARALRNLLGQEQPGSEAPAEPQPVEPEPEEPPVLRGAWSSAPQPPLPPPTDDLPVHPLTRRSTIDPTAPHAWAGVPAAPLEEGPGYQYAELIGETLARRYRVVTLFPSQSSVLLLATDVRNGHYVLLKPDTEPHGRRGQTAHAAFVHQGTPFVLSNIGLNGISLRHFMGVIGRMPAQQAIDYGLRLIGEAGRSKRPLLERRAWSPDAVLIDQDGALDLAAPTRRTDADPPRPSPLSPPEHSAGGPLDERSDVYLVGAFIYYLLTGAPPPEPVPAPVPEAPPAGKNGQAGRPVATFRTAPDLPPHLAGVLATALQPAPGARYPTLAALETALAQLADEFRKMSQAARRDRESRLQRLRMAALIAAGLLVAFLGAVVVWAAAPFLLSLVSRPNLSASPPPPTTATPNALLSIFAVGGVTDTDHLRINQIAVQNVPTTTVYFSVVSTGNQPVGGLVTGDFRITADSVPISDSQIVNVRTTTETVATLLVLDVSRDMMEVSGREVQTATRQFLGLLAPGDQAGLIAAGDQPEVLQDLAVTPTLVLSQVDVLQAASRTVLYDALYLAASTAAQQPGRTALLALSTGKDTASVAHTGEEVVQFCRAHSIPIYIVGLTNAPGYNRAPLVALAGQTGGELLETADAGKLSEVFQRIAEQLHGQYRAAFTGPAEPGNHMLSITLQAGTHVYSDTVPYVINRPIP